MRLGSPFAQEPRVDEIRGHAPQPIHQQVHPAEVRANQHSQQAALL